MKYLLLLLCSCTAFSQLDSTFGTNGLTAIPGSYPCGIKIQDDGKILVLMQKNNFTSLVRLMPDGTVDNTFVFQNLVIAGTTTSYPLNMVVQNDGKIVAMINTNTTSTSNTLVRFNTDGTIDSSFGNNGYIFNAFQQGSNVVSYARIAIDPVSGNILIAGNIYISSSNAYSTYMPVITCYTSSGILNTAFYGSGIRGWAPSENRYIMDIAIDTNGKVIVAGNRNYGSYSPEPGKDDWIFRMNSDASTDSTFSDDGSFTTNVGNYWASNSRSANSAFIKDNGQILVIGHGGDYFTKKFMVYELSTDGVLMNASMPVFFQKTNYNMAHKVVRDNDGKFILAGSMVHYSAGGSFGMLKVDSNNSIDTAFGINGWITNTDQTATNSFVSIAALKVQPADNKIVISGMTATNVVTIARYLNTTTTALHSEDFQVEHLVQVYPNPAGDNLNMRIEDNSLLNEEYAIADLNGRILAKGVLNNPTSTINIEKLSKGMYLLIIAKGSLTQKFIKK